MYARADDGMDNWGKDMRGDGASDCSKAPEVEIERSSEISNMFWEGKGAVQDYAKVSNTGNKIQMDRPHWCHDLYALIFLSVCKVLPNDFYWNNTKLEMNGNGVPEFASVVKIGYTIILISNSRRTFRYPWANAYPWTLPALHWITIRSVERSWSTHSRQTSLIVRLLLSLLNANLFGGLLA